MHKIIKELGLNTTLNKPETKTKIFNKVKNNIPLYPNMNEQMDLLHLPETKEGFKYLLVIVDLASDKFDVEPIKKTNSKTILDAMLKIFARPYVKKPWASLRMDNGAEFKKDVKEWLYNNNIVARYAMPYRHKQLGSVENLNKQLGTLFGLYMNEVELITGSQYKEWTDILPYIRIELNKSRVKTYTNQDRINKPLPADQQIPTPIYKVGDEVHYRLAYPKNALNEKQPTAQFRSADFYFSLYPVKIMKIVQMNDKPYNRYILDGMKYVSFPENELKLAMKKKDEPDFKIQKNWEVKPVKNKLSYLVQFKKQLKINSVWLTEKELIDKGYQKDIDRYYNN